MDSLSKALLLHSPGTVVNLSALNTDGILFSQIHCPHPASVIYSIPPLGLNPGWGPMLHLGVMSLESNLKQFLALVFYYTYISEEYSHPLPPPFKIEYFSSLTFFPQLGSGYKFLAGSLWKWFYVLLRASCPEAHEVLPLTVKKVYLEGTERGRTPSALRALESNCLGLNAGFVLSHWAAVNMIVSQSPRCKTGI